MSEQSTTDKPAVHPPTPPAAPAGHSAERQREIYEPAEIRKRTWKARNALVSDAKLRPALKSVLRALWDFTRVEAASRDRATTKRQHRDALNARYGPIIEAMPAAEFDHLCQQADLTIFERRAMNQSGRLAPLALPSLLKCLQAIEHQQAPQPEPLAPDSS